MLAGKSAVRNALLPPTTTAMKQPNVVAALAKMYKTFLHSTSAHAHSTRTLAQSSHKLITAQHSQQQQQQQWRNLSIGSASQAQSAKKSDGAEANKEEIERLVLQHQVKGVSMPVRAEFVRDKPLSTKDLESIDIRVYHRKPVTISDHVAYRSVKLLRFFADTFFRKRYVHRAIVLETVAGVPGMVAGMLCHMRSLRRMQHDNGWIEKLLHEAENERMHLMIWMKVTEPTVPERLLVTFVQGLFFNAYMLYYLLFPRTAHRFVGYLEEEAIVSYNAFAKEVLNGNIRNTPAPKIAIDYYNLETEAKLLDVVYAVRADEAAHRDANHNFADRIDDHKENLSPQPKRGEPKPEKVVEEKSVDDVKQP